MSNYTTGELAKLCGVSVRTVQYYDDRGILVPNALSEGGRRLYSDDDLSRMRVICFLRDAGLPIKSISALLAEEKPESLVSVILEQQESSLREELSALESKLALVEGIRRELRSVEKFSVESIGDIARIMEQKKMLRKMHWTMVLTGLPVSVLQCVAVILGITNGLWWLLGAWAAVAIPWGIFISKYYFNHVAYICPDCHEVFAPRIKAAFFAHHTPKMRRLTCPHCGRNGLCVEIYREKEGK